MSFDRRQLLSSLAALGIGTPIFHRAVVAMTQDGQTDTERIKEAAWITDLEISDSEAGDIQELVRRILVDKKTLRQFKLDSNVPPAFHFQPKHNQNPVSQINRDIENNVNEKLPDDDDEIAFCSVPKLAHFLASKQLTSVRLTQIYLQRLKKYGPMLRCVVNLTEDLAMQQAKLADEEIAAGKIRGSLHGIPWGAKDLIDVPGYPTTWGIPHNKERMADEPATVYSRLQDAGAVLVAKLSLGALAMGDQWFGGMTRNPWNPTSGSSGSSAGSCSATVAGLVGFAIGSETLGSITTPSKVCGANGFRPTFGRVSRHGCMPLSWTMDKIGPICRSVAGCAFVFTAIHGADGKDQAAQSYAFDWPVSHDASKITIGYQKGRKIEESEEFKALAEIGFELKPATLKPDFKIYPLARLIDVEAASVFDELLRAGHTEGWNAWGDIFRATQFVSGVDYIHMMRARSKVIEEFDQFMSEFDVLFNVYDVFHTNLTGHPSVVIPVRFKDLDSGGKLPVTATLTGHLNADDRLLWVAHQLQQKLSGHLKTPPLELWLEKFGNGTLDPKNEEPADT